MSAQLVDVVLLRRIAAQLTALADEVEAGTVSDLSAEERVQNAVEDLCDV